MTAGLQLHGLGVTRGGSAVVDALDLDAPPGTVIAVTGSAGSGKSSLLATLAGRLRAESGAVTLHGIPVDDARLMGRIGTVTQEHELIPTLTSVENVDLAALADGTPADAAWLHSIELLQLLDLPASAQANLTEELSGGQHQRVAVARALAGDPALVLADDPTSELDAVSTAHVITALRLAATTGAVVVVATTEPLLVAAADVVVLLDEQDVRAATPSPFVPPTRRAHSLAAHGQRPGSRHPAPGLRYEPGQLVSVTLAKASPLCSVDDGGTIPRSHLSATSRGGGSATVLLPWDSTELAVEVGDELTVLRLERRSGRPLCRSADGRVGRVPSAILDLDPAGAAPSA